MGIQSVFPTILYSEDLPEKKAKRLNKELLEEAHQIREFDEEGRAWSEQNYVGGYTSYASLANLHQFTSTFMELEEVLNEHVWAYAKELDFDISPEQLFMTDCWLNIMPAGTAHSFHLHPLSLISGTYYVSTPPRSASIRFEDPRIQCFMNRPPIQPDYKKRSRQFIKMKAKAGRVILFESWLKHEVPAAQTKKERISISFNYNWTPEDPNEEADYEEIEIG